MNEEVNYSICVQAIYGEAIFQQDVTTVTYDTVIATPSCTSDHTQCLKIQAQKSMKR